MKDNYKDNYQEDVAAAERERMSYKEYISIRQHFRSQYSDTEAGREKAKNEFLSYIINRRLWKHL